MDKHLFINIAENDCPSLLKDISNIKFPQLKKLVLFRNNIETVEGLLRMDLPAIESFYISKKLLT